MFGPYRAVLTVRGAAAFTSAGFLMRFPIALYPVGLVLLVSLRTGEYSFAGLLSAAYIAGGAIGNPLLGRLVDRYGQHRFLVPASVLHALAVAVLIGCVESGTPRGIWLVPALAAGITYLAVGALTRARWAAVLAGTPQLSTAFALESTLDETIFVTGPLLATLLATLVDPVAPLVVAPLLVLAGAVLLARQRETEPPRHGVATSERGSLLHAPMLLLVLCMAAMGATFAGVELGSVAFAGQHEQTRWAGVVLACFAFGSAFAGLFYGTRTWSSPLGTRFRIQAALFAVLPLVLFGAVSVPVLAVAVAVVGLGIAPLIITSFGMVEALVPPGRLTEGMSWLTTGLNVGFGAAAAVVGGVADVHGARVAFAVPMGTALLTGGLGWLAVTLARRRPSTGSPPPVECHDGARAALP